MIIKMILLQRGHWPLFLHFHMQEQQHKRVISKLINQPKLSWLHHPDPRKARCLAGDARALPLISFNCLCHFTCSGLLVILDVASWRYDWLAGGVVEL